MAAAASLTALQACGPLSQRAQLLEHSALLQDFSPAEADALGAAMQLVRARPGEVLIAEGTVDDWMMLLISGTVDVTKRKVGATADDEEPGDTTRLAVIRPGAVIGEMSMLDGEPRYATCTAIDEVEAAVLTRAAVARLIQDQPPVAAKLLVKLTQLLAQRLRNTSNQLIKSIQARSADGAGR